VTNVFSAQGFDGHNLGVSQPVSGSVTGSPISASSEASQTVGPFGAGLVYITTEIHAVHIKFSRLATDAATISDLKIGGRVNGETYSYQFAVDSGDYLHVIEESGGGNTGKVYVEQAKTSL